MSVVEEMYSPGCSMQSKKENNCVYWGSYFPVLFSGKLRDKCECISVVRIVKDPWVCTEGSLVYAI